MRVESIISINANHKHNPYTAENTGLSTGKTNSGIAFADYLKANLQEVSSPEVSRQTENQLAGLLIGYFTPLKFSQKDPKAEQNAG